MKLFLIACFAILSFIHGFAQEQADLRIANAQLTGTSPDSLQFDVQIRGDLGTSCIRYIQVYFDYNTEAFGSNIASSIQVTKGTLTADTQGLTLYTIQNIVDNQSDRITFTVSSDFQGQDCGSTIIGIPYHRLMPSTFKTFAQVTIPIISATQLPHISFHLPAIGQIFYQTNPAGTQQSAQPDSALKDLLVFPLRPYDIIWDGVTWSGGSAPGNTPGTGDNSKDLLAETGTTQPLPGDATIRNIIIQDSALLDLGGNTITVTGGVFGLVEGTVVNGIIEFAGTASQEITGDGFWENVIINNANGVDITHGELAITGVLTPTDGAFNTNGLLRLAATAADTFAQIAPGAGSVNGDVRFEMVIESAGWHNLASPVQGATFDDWEESVIINYDGAAGGESALYWDAGATDWVAVADSSHSLDGRGFSVYIGPNFIRPGGGVNADGQLPVRLTLTGEINDNNFSTPNLGWADPASGGWQSYNGAQGGASGNDGWNLVPNPYPSMLDFAEVNQHADFSTDINGYAYIWNPASGQYEYSNGTASSTNGSPLIAPMQAYWMKIGDATTAAGTSALNLDDPYRTTSGNARIFKSNEDFVRLGIVQDNTAHTDELQILWSADATDGYDSRYDAFKFRSGDPARPTFFSISADSLSLAVNALAKMPDYDTVAIGFVGTQGESYTIGLDSTNIQGVVGLSLYDRKTAQSYDLRLQQPTFTHDTLFDQHRFDLFVDNAISVVEEVNIRRPFYVNSENHVITIRFGTLLSPSADLEVIDLGGRVLYAKENVSTLEDYRFSFRTSLRTVGFYMLRLHDRATDEVMVEKFLY